MNRSIFILASLLLLAGCDDHPREWVAWGNVIPVDKKAEASKWLIDVVEAANPRSDEEPEDSIAQAEKTMFKIFGVPTVGIRSTVNGVWVFIPYEKCNARQKKMCDKYLREG